MRIFNKILNFIKLPMIDKLLFAEAIFLDMVFRFVILTFPLKYYAFLLGKQGIASPETEELIINDKIKSVMKAAKRAFRESQWDSVCFDKALTVKIMLKRRNISSTIYFGLMKEDKNMMKAHAWLRYGKYILTGKAGMHQFKVVSFFT